MSSPDAEYAHKQARCDRLIRLARQQPEWLLGFADEVWWGRLADPALHACQDDDHPWRLIEQTVAQDDPVTVQVTAEEDPAMQVTAGDDAAPPAAAAMALTVRTGSGVDMDVQPTEVAGRAATFRLTYHNHSPAPVALALLAHASEEGVRFRPEPAEPVVVPGDRVGSVVVHVVPKVRPLVGVPQAYGIVFRALPLWTMPQGTVELVREARFTYVPYVRLPALARAPVWVRRLPAWSGVLALVLLVLLLVLAGDRPLATATRIATRMSTPRRATTPTAHRRLTLTTRPTATSVPHPTAVPDTIVIHNAPRTAVVGQAERFSVLLPGRPHTSLTYILHYPDGHEDHIPVRTDGHGYSSGTFRVSPYHARRFRDMGTVGVEDANGRVLASTHIAIQQH
jgi:hypothetical protein